MRPLLCLLLVGCASAPRVPVEGTWRQTSPADTGDVVTEVVLDGGEVRVRTYFQPMGSTDPTQVRVAPPRHYWLRADGTLELPLHGRLLRFTAIVTDPATCAVLFPSRAPCRSLGSNGYVSRSRDRRRYRRESDGPLTTLRFEPPLHRLAPGGACAVAIERGRQRRTVACAVADTADAPFRRITLDGEPPLYLDPARPDVLYLAPEAGALPHFYSSSLPDGDG
jgi:hypothetical protein